MFAAGRGQCIAMCNTLRILFHFIVRCFVVICVILRLWIIIVNFVVYRNYDASVDDLVVLCLHLQGRKTIIIIGTHGYSTDYVMCMYFFVEDLENNY